MNKRKPLEQFLRRRLNPSRLIKKKRLVEGPYGHNDQESSVIISGSKVPDNKIIFNTPLRLVTFHHSY